jgi:K+-sensing histidine kinase KdpD
MVVNLLDISRIEEGRIELKSEKANINTIIKDIAIRISDYPENEQKQIVVDLDSHLPEILADKSVIERVLENLINFAVTNADEDGKVLISTSSADGQKVQFITHDSGTQIPKNFHDKIFEKFSQAEIKNSGSRVDRALGLTFCKLAVEAHQGRMWLDLENKIGNKFIIELPVNSAH